MAWVEDLEDLRAPRELVLEAGKLWARRSKTPPNIAGFRLALEDAIARQRKAMQADPRAREAALLAADRKRAERWLEVSDEEHWRRFPMQYGLPPRERLDAFKVALRHQWDDLVEKGRQHPECEDYLAAHDAITREPDQDRRIKLWADYYRQTREERWASRVHATRELEANAQYA